MTSPAPSTRRRRMRAGLAAGLVAGLALALLPAGSTAATGVARVPRVFTPVTGATFNRPVGTAGQQRAIFTQLNKTVAAAPRDSVIRMAVFSFSEKATADALLAAHQRGVRVQLIFDDHVVYAQEARLRRALGGNPEHRSFVVYCHRSCRSTGGNMHDKFFTFSRAGRASYVSMAGSNNITRHNAVDQWSDVYTVVNNRALYGRFYHVFSQMKWDRPMPSPYQSADVGAYQTQFFPSGPMAMEDDPLYRVLEQVRCTGLTFPTGYDSTALRIAMHAWNGDRGLYLARKVADLQSEGCRAYVVYGVGMGSQVRNILTEAGVALSAGTRSGVRTHQKTLSIRGVYGDNTAAKVVWTGSHNWTDGSFGRDEVIFRVSGARAWGQYYSNFTDMWRNG